MSELFDGLLGVAAGGGFSLAGVWLQARLSRRDQQELADRDYTHQLRLASLDRRLDAHQKGFRLWLELTGTAGGEWAKLLSILGRRHQFMRENVVFLDRATFQEFQWYVHFAHTWGRLEYHSEKAWNRLDAAGEVILGAVNLLPINPGPRRDAPC